MPEPLDKRIDSIYRHSSQAPKLHSFQLAIGDQLIDEAPAATETLCCISYREQATHLARR